MMLHNVVVIGAGPAGISAAIQLKRAGLEPLVLERKAIGGLVSNANLIENYPGFPNGIKGSELVELFKKHLKNAGVKVVKKEAEKIYPGGKYLCILCNRKGIGRNATSKSYVAEYITTGKNKIFANSVIVATGTMPKTAGIKGEAELVGRRVFYELTELLHIQNNAVITIIGGGDAAFDYALNLSATARKINIIFRKYSRCIPLLMERARKMSNIKIISKTVPVSLEESGNALIVRCIKDGKINTASCDYALIAVGREPSLTILPKNMRKSRVACKHGIFFAGDVKRGSSRYAGMAVGDGLLAANDVINFLKVKK